MTTPIVVVRLNGDDRPAMVETVSLLPLVLREPVLVRRTEGRAEQTGARQGVGPAPPRRPGRPGRDALDPSARVPRTESARGRTRRRVTLPLLRPALAAGASLAFVTAFGDFVTSIMLRTYNTRPISLEILASLRQAGVGTTAADGVVLRSASAAGFLLAGETRGATG